VVAGDNGDVRRIKETLYGPPYPGLEARVNQFIATFEAVEKTRHEENQAQLAQINSKMGQRALWTQIAGVAIALAGVMVAIAALAATLYIAKHAALDPLKLWGNQPSSVLSSTEDSIVAPH
jgi:hypothetical protein